MKTIDYINTLPVNNPESLTDIDLPQPIATGRELLVKIK